MSFVTGLLMRAQNTFKNCSEAFFLQEVEFLRSLFVEFLDHDETKLNYVCAFEYFLPLFVLNTIGKPQLGILWSRDSLGFKRLCGNNPGTIWSTF